MEEHRKPWKPLSVEAVRRLFEPADFRWWVAGGHAIELAVWLVQAISRVYGPKHPWLEPLSG